MSYRNGLHKKKLLVFWLLLLFWSHVGFTRSIDVHNKPQLQRGAKVFMNYCSGCHSLRYLRYSSMAEGLGLLGFDGRVDEGLLKSNLIFTHATINDPIRIALPPEDAKQWFGVVPPDLSLVAREKGVDWLYAYLNGFYNDNARPFGTNNILVPGVAMPDILESLKSQHVTQQQFDSLVWDLVTFLAYVGEPEQSARYRLGPFVLIFFGVLLLAAVGLKTMYWRKIT